MGNRNTGGAWQQGYIPILGNGGVALDLTSGSAFPNIRRAQMTTTSGLAGGATHILPLKASNLHLLSASFKWFDDVLQFSTFVLETTDFDEIEAPIAAAAADELWHVESGITLVGPNADAGLVQFWRMNVSAIAAKRARLRAVVAAAGPFAAMGFGKV